MWYFISGLCLSITYVTLIFIGRPDILEQFTKLKLNELGDFLAGAFSPLAFLWLVIGYMMQGKELKLNRETLALQAEELKNSVEKQGEMIRLNEQQVYLEKNKIEENRLHEEIENCPSDINLCIKKNNLKLNLYQQPRYSCYIQNKGGCVVDIKISIKTFFKANTAQFDDSFMPENKIPFTFNKLSYKHSEMHIFDSNFKFNCELFRIVIVEVGFTEEITGLEKKTTLVFQIENNSEFIQIAKI